MLLAAFVVLAPHAVAQKVDDGAIAHMRNMIKQMIFDGVQTAPADDKGGMARQMFAMAGRDDLAAEHLNRPTCVPLQGDPLAEIVKRARETSIVIVNEDHAEPYDRHFIAQMLTALKVEGYTVYAAETFAPGRDVSHAGALGDDGFYINEPVYGRTLGLAKSLGYRIVAYEQTREQDEAVKQANPAESQINRREMAQTENLMKAVFDADPDAKVLIHVGHAHAWERKRSESKGTEVWMAERLKARSGRDPLTVDQTVCASTSGASVAADGFTKSDGTIQPAQTVDLLVGHPPLAFRDGRVTWRQDLGEKITPMPKEFTGRAENVLIEARLAGAEPDIVPADRILLRPGEALPLLLPPGRYRVEGFTQAGPIEGAAVMIDVP
jgi:hypothetical protein